MKKMYALSLTAVTLMSFAGTGFAQLNCNTDQMVKQSLEANPSLLADFQKEQDRLEALDKEAFAKGYKTDEKAAAVIYTIPIVFHVIHEYGTEDISDAQIIDEVRILNNDYRKLNADISAVVASFTGITSDAQIQFRLAQKDPSGNCTNGIDRVYSALTNSADDGSKLNDWPRNKYLNVWTVKSIGTAGVAGYAYLPGSAPGSANDGVLILSNYIGSIGTGSIATSRALTHEIGHFLNLEHTWGGTNNPGVACGDDFVGDTPVTMGHTSCSLSDATCTSGVIENVQNYMEYAYCSNMFTAGQTTRMRNALTSSMGQRSSLWTAANLTATGVSTPSVLCTADFTSNNSTNTICQGDSIKFTDISWNGNPTGWSWTFPGGTPATSTDSTPTITYNTPGIYNVSLTVSNASGSVSATKTSYVTVNSSTGMYNASIYSEGFEGSAIPNVDWQVHNILPGGNTWVQTAAAASTGTKSVKITNLSTYDTYVDELIGPSIDMTAITGTSPTMTFKVAYAQRTSTSNDKLQLYVSTNCGKTWALRKTISGTTMSTAPVNTGTFTPTASQWATQSVNLSGYATQPDLYFMFRFTSNGGNNIYLDDININGTSTSGAGINELANSINFNVYPNPIEETSVVAFDLSEKANINMKIMDVLGRDITTVFKGELAAGQHQYIIGDNAKLSSGIYFITVNVNGRSFSKKLIVK